jgi:histone acetyltransferase HTATIP
MSETSKENSRAGSVAVDSEGMVKGEISPNDVRVGFKCYAEKAGEKRRAEILSTHVRKGKLVFYVHYEEFNKRLDEWIPAERLDLTMPVEIPKPEKPKKTPASGKESAKNNKVAKKGKKTSKKGKPTPAGGKENDEAAAKEVLGEDEMDLDDVQPNGQVETGEFNREEEIEKLRTSGSMTQNSHEIARVRNLSSVIMGAHEIEPWYFSPYPVELTEEDVIYICEFSLCYFGSKKQFERFRSKCTLRHPPGNEIYRDDENKISFFEIDGRRQRTWCRNLCLFSKLFLDHKTLYYDVDPFLFYCMTKQDERGHHLVGYFSKEKESADNYNVACILTLPQYQRHGYGRVLIDFSYNLSMKEGKHGSPEKPLSDLGLLSYRAYWADTIVELLMETKKPEMTIEDVANITAMTTTDVLHTLQTLNMLKYYKGQHIICLTEAIVQKYERQKQKKRIRIDANKLQWKPPVFTAAQLRFAW